MRILVRQVRGRKKHPNWTGIYAEVARTIDAEVKPKLLKYPEKVVANWEHKPKFGSKKTIGKDISVYVYPTGPNAKYWTWTSRGTKEHRIPKTGDKLLAFPSTYTPKTTPQGPGYGGPGESSGDMVIVHPFVHPGTRPRHFEEAWTRYTKKWFKKTIEAAMKRGARKA